MARTVLFYMRVLEGNVRHLRSPLRAASVFGLSVFALALSGCGTAIVSGATTVGAAIATPAATATPAGLPKLPTTTIASGPCGQNGPQSAPLSPADGLVVTQFAMLGNLAYPAAQIPDGQTGPILEPQLTQLDHTTDPSSGAVAVNPGLREGGGGYVIAVCNPSNQPHTLNAVQASIAMMSPFTDKLEAWEPCNGVYLPAYKSVGGGCGGGDVQDEYLHAPFAADAAVGATVAATQTSAGTIDHNYGPLPASIPPGQTMSVEVGVTPPSAPGYYTYSFALTVDGANTGVVAYSPKTLLAPVSVAWTGKACLSSDMQAQIAQAPTPSSNSIGYICPGS